MSAIRYFTRRAGQHKHVVMHKISAEPHQVTTRYGYVPAIDGLRFFAVGSVLLFHLWRPILQGGFIGVDVFFVISGYLITGVLTNSLRAPTLMQFYQNRIARIAPASLFTISSVLIAGYFLYDRQDFAYLGSAGAFAALSVINIKLLFQSSYFSASSIAQPLLHFWSLSLEEQFYLIYPAFLIAAGRFRMPVIALSCILSFIVCVWLTWYSQNWAFYFIVSRAWELLAGGWLALRIKEYAYGQFIGWLGLTILLTSFAVISEDNSFPGIQAIFPVIGTLFMLEGTRTTGAFSDFLSLRPLRWVGVRSFSLYLWHWPVYSFSDYALWQQSWHQRLIVKISITILLSIISYSIVENPARVWLRLKSNRVATFTAFFLAIFIISVAGTFIRKSNYLSAEGGILTRGGYLYRAQHGPRVTVIGDSEGAMYGTVLRDIASKNNWNIRLLVAAATNELKDEPNSRWPVLEPWLYKDKPNVVVIIYNWKEKLAQGVGLENTLIYISSIGARAVIVLEPPRPSSREDYNPHIAGQLRMPEYRRDWRRRIDMTVRKIAARHSGTTIVDPVPLFLGPDGTVTIASPGTRPAFYDFAHLSYYGAKQAAPLIETAIRDALKTAKP